MDKIKIFPKRRQFISRSRGVQQGKSCIKATEAEEITIREDANVTELDPLANLLDADLIGSAIMQCLIENDPEGVMEIIGDHLYALNKSKFLKEAQVPRSTMYQLLKRKNPTVRTLAKIMHATHH